MSAIRPDVPLRTEEVARLLGWATQRTGRWLDRLAEKDPSIMVRVRGRRMVTLASLRRVCPDLAKRFASERDVESLADEQREQASELRQVAMTVREFRAQAHRWYAELDKRLRAVEKSR